MTEQAKVPEIRFAGFTDPWEQRKLGEFGSVAMCKRIYKEQTSEQGDVPFFKIGTFGADPDAFISNELFEDCKRTYPYPTPGTLLISAAGSIGRIVEYQGEKAYFQDSNIVWLEHDHRLNDAFLKPLYSKIEWGLEGSTIKRLYNKDLLSAEVTIPDGREQKEIGQFFAKLDSLITLHQRKYDKLVIFKKSMLEKMFPKDGESVPEIRFAGFTDPWEQRKLGELSSEFQSGDFISAEKILASGPYPVYGGNGLRGYAKRYNHDGFYALIGRQGALCGNVNTAVGKAYFTEHAVAIKANSLHDTRFLVHLLRCMDLGQYSGQSAQPGLAVGVLKEVETTVPSKVEQQAIGSFFSRLDDLITLHQRKLELLQNIKKSLLDKMFV